MIARGGMRARRRAVCAAIMIGSTAVLPAGTAAADVTLASGLPAKVKVAMRGDTVAWSAPAAGGWKLVIWRRGVLTDAAMRPASAPFDVDLGEDAAGRLIATYSRCSEPPVGLERPRGCDVYLYDVDRERERRVARLGIGGASDYLPTASHGRIAFARSIDGGPARLYVRALAGGRLRKLPGGLQDSDERTGPRVLDLGARGLAFAWAAGKSPTFPFGIEEARFDLLGGGHRLLERYVQFGTRAINIVGISATATGVLWGTQETGENDDPSLLHFRPRLRTPATMRRRLTTRMQSMSGTNVDRVAILTIQQLVSPTWSVVLLTPP